MKIKISPIRAHIHPLFVFWQFLHVSTGLVLPGAPWDGRNRLMGGFQIPAHTHTSAHLLVVVRSRGAPHHPLTQDFATRFRPSWARQVRAHVHRSVILLRGCANDVCCELLRRWNWKRRARSAGARTAQVPYLPRLLVLYEKGLAQKEGTAHPQLAFEIGHDHALMARSALQCC